MEQRRATRPLTWILIGLAVFVVFVGSIFTLVYFAFRNGEDFEYTRTGMGEKIAVVDLEGVILSPEDTVRALKKFADDRSIKAIILHINTPGGGAAASEEIYREVKRIRDEKKKMIVASVETVGASGGYYVASATNKIYANQASVVGSIGVIAEWFNYGELMQWAKLKPIILKAGQFKDAGSGTRDLTPAEREYMQALINDMHQQFIRAVAEGRNAKEEDIKAIADGKVWTGQQALGLKLVDSIGDFQTAVRETAKAVGIEGEPSLVKAEKRRRSLFDIFFSDASELVPDPTKMMETHVGFYYLWK
ncbi:MAG TPA: signal peptide peptidase SppA [Clostridia bacterium]|nr:signal peptide peptidase SppA [Clostridia bacterium]